jgi:hypothetical protein
MLGRHSGQGDGKATPSNKLTFGGLGGGVVSIKPRHLRLNCENPRLYVSIAKNHEFSANYLQFALIAN